MDENCTPLWKFKILTQNLDNKMSTTNGMEKQKKKKKIIETTLKKSETI